MMKRSIKSKFRTLMFLFIIALSIVLSGCGDDPKSLVKSSLDDKSGAKIIEVYNKKNSDEKSKFAKEITVAYFEQAKADLSRKNNPSYTQYFYNTLTDLVKHIDSNDKHFANVRNLQQLMQTRESKADEYMKIFKQLGLSLEKDGLSYSNAGPIRRYRLYINHRVFNNDYNPLYGAVEPQTIGNGFIGTMEIPSDKYVAAVHIPKEGVFANGPGVYTFYAAQAGNYTIDVAGFPRNVMLLQLIYDDQVNLVRRLINFGKERDNLLERTIPYYVNKVLENPDNVVEIEMPRDSSGTALVVPAKKLHNPADTPNAAAINKAIAKTSSSSALNDNGQVYSADKAFDSDNRTCWAEGVSGLGIGESITVDFNGDYKVSGFRIWAGYHKNKDLFYKNSRPTAIRVIGSDGSNEVYAIADSFEEQDIHFKRPVSVKSLKLVIEKVAKGNKYEDTCISDISFF